MTVQNICNCKFTEISHPRIEKDTVSVLHLPVKDCLLLSVYRKEKIYKKEGKLSTNLIWSGLKCLSYLNKWTDLCNVYLNNMNDLIQLSFVIKQPVQTIKKFIWKNNEILWRFLYIKKEYSKEKRK